MRTRLVKGLSVCLFLVPAMALLASSGQPGLFLRAGEGARPLGLGGAFCALADDASAAYWNPSGLAQLNAPAMTSMYSVLSLGRSANYLSIALPLGHPESLGILGQRLPDMGAWGGYGVWAISWVNTSLGNDFEGRTKDSADYYLFGDQQNAYCLSHARALTNWLSLGATLKFIDRTLETHHADGWGVDLGALVLFHPHLTLGLVFQDLSSHQTWDTGYAETFPNSTRIGLASRWFENALVFSGELYGVSGEAMVWSCGGEYWFMKILGMRLGYGAEALSAGASMKLDLFKEQICLDYGYTTAQGALGDTHRLSLSVSF